MKTVDPDGKITEWQVLSEWTNDDGSVIQMSRPKDQDQDEPATPPQRQTRNIGWTGYLFTAQELRGWLDKIPNQATIIITVEEPWYSIEATWDVTP